MNTPPSDATWSPERRDWFRRSVDLLGGGREAARQLGISEASMRKLLSDGPNARGIRDGIVADMRELLRDHAAACTAQADALISEG